MAAAAAARRFLPLFDRVLIEKAEAITRTRGGIMIPENARAKILEGTVVAVGQGAKNEKGDNIPMSVQVGDKVLLPEYGGTKVATDDKEYFLYREGDILAKMQS